MKFFSGTSTLDFTWEQVATAFWQRYPNPYSKHVLSEDIISRSIVDGKLVSKRLLTKVNSVPKWGEKFVQGIRFVMILEESIIDPVKKTIITYSRNINHQRLMGTEEKCIYEVNPDNNSVVLCQKFAWLDSQVYGLRTAISKFAYDRYKKNEMKATAGFTSILEKLFKPYLLTSEQGQLLTPTEKLKEKAKKAKEFAKKSKAPIHMIPK